MTLQEFAKLKPGDKIVNPINGSDTAGEVTSIDASGVRVVWGPRKEGERSFFYSVNSTAWMHWSKAVTPE